MRIGPCPCWVFRQSPWQRPQYWGHSLPFMEIQLCMMLSVNFKYGTPFNSYPCTSQVLLYHFHKNILCLGSPPKLGIFPTSFCNNCVRYAWLLLCYSWHNRGSENSQPLAIAHGREGWEPFRGLITVPLENWDHFAPADGRWDENFPGRSPAMTGYTSVTMDLSDLSGVPTSWWSRGRRIRWEWVQCPFREWRVLEEDPVRISR